MSSDIIAAEWKCYPFIAMFSLSGTFFSCRTLLLLLIPPSFSPTSLLRQPKWRDANAESRGRTWRRGKGGEELEKAEKFPKVPLSQPS